jgi:formate hydrogenlyase subunit 6/NADH:ubiquinone oxidoreductase subunit I
LEGNELITNGNSYSQKDRRKESRFNRYTLKYSTCIICAFAEECVGGRLKKSQGKVIQRYEFEDAMDHNNEQVALRINDYKRRQAIVEPASPTRRAPIWNHKATMVFYSHIVKNEEKC